LPYLANSSHFEIITKIIISKQKEQEINKTRRNEALRLRKSGEWRLLPLKSLTVPKNENAIGFLLT
jgi:hypothetical protein